MWFYTISIFCINSPNQLSDIMKAGDTFSHFVFYFPLKDLNFYLKCFHHWCVSVYLPCTRTLHLLSFSAQFFSSQPCPRHPTPYPCGSTRAHKHTKRNSTSLEILSNSFMEHGRQCPHLSLQGPRYSTKPQGFLSLSNKISSEDFIT